MNKRLCLWDGGGSLLTQWIARYGYVPIVLIGMACLALEIGTGEWKSGGTIVAEAPVVAETFVERWPPTLETEAEPKARMQLAALDPYARLPDESDQPASKGYIMAPVPLSDESTAPRTTTRIIPLMRRLPNGTSYISLITLFLKFHLTRSQPILF